MPSCSSTVDFLSSSCLPDTIVHVKQLENLQDYIPYWFRLVYFGPGRVDFCPSWGAVDTQLRPQLVEVDN